MVKWVKIDFIYSLGHHPRLQFSNFLNVSRCTGVLTLEAPLIVPSRFIDKLQPTLHLLFNPMRFMSQKMRFCPPRGGKVTDCFFLAIRNIYLVAIPV